MDHNEKKTPSEWEAFTNIQIIDPDGWDRKDFEASWSNPITAAEWYQRMARSTVKFLRG